MKRPIVFFDASCGLCQRSIYFLACKDAAGALFFAPLDGETARALLPKRLNDARSVIFYDKGRLFIRSKAVFHAFRYLAWPWRALSFLRFFPAFLFDPIYRLVASNRYALSLQDGLLPKERMLP